MKHARSCPRSAPYPQPMMECTCGGMDPVPPGLTVDGKPLPVIFHAGGCQFMRNADKPCTCGVGLPAMTPGTPGAGATQPKVTDDNPYRDVERSRSLAARAEAAALEGKDDLAHFLLQLASEARLLAELQGRWEY